MAMTHRILSVVFLLLATSTLSTVRAQPDEMVKRFFETYQERGSTAALDDLYDSNPWMSKAEDAVQNLKTQMEGLTEDFVGKFHGYEEITTKSLSSSFVLKSYLVRFDRQPLRFTFEFYKPDDTWRIYGFQYDGSLDDEIEEAAKLYYLLNQ